MSHMKEDMELWEFDFASIAKATDNFASYNKLGEGGFGPVYKVIFWHSAEFKSGFLFIQTNSKRSITEYIGRGARNCS